MHQRCMYTAAPSPWPSLPTVTILLTCGNVKIAVKRGKKPQKMLMKNTRPTCATHAWKSFIRGIDIPIAGPRHTPLGCTICPSSTRQRVPEVLSAACPTDHAQGFPTKMHTND